MIQLRAGDHHEHQGRRVAGLAAVVDAECTVDVADLVVLDRQAGELRRAQLADRLDVVVRRNAGDVGACEIIGAQCCEELFDVLAGRSRSQCDEDRALLWS